MTAIRTYFTVSLLLLASVLATLAGPTVKGERAYKEHDKIVLTADGIEKGTQILWDVSGDADVEEGEGGKLYVWAKPGSYSVTMTAINFDTKKVTRARFTFVVLPSIPPKPPEPEPKPPEPKPPEPQPSPAPIPAEGFRVLIVEDVKARQKLPPTQLMVLFDKKVRTYLDAKCVMGSDRKTREWRIWDQGVDASSESKLWQDVMKRHRKSLPWIVISDGKRGYEGPLPEDVDQTLALLKKYGGE